MTYDPTKAPLDINSLAAEVHKENATWWHDPATGAPISRNMGELCMLMISEVAEAMEGERKDLMDDKLPHRKMAEVEMADVVIRLLDLAGNKGWELKFHKPYPLIHTNIGEQLMYICIQIGCIYNTHVAYDGEDFADIEYSYYASRVLSLVDNYCRWRGYDLWSAVHEKRAYNRNRADHKPENRVKEGGKKW